MQGTLLNGRYQILKSLGRGGFGETFLAKDCNLPNYPQCVVKLHDPQDKNPKLLKEAHERFLKEIFILRKLNHPQIPRFLDSFEENQKYYLVQEYIDGHSLGEELPPKQECWSESQVITMLIDILKILEVVHNKNNKIIHRDIKPDNIIRRRSDQKLVLIDFGAVKQITPSSPINTKHRYTITIGTTGYMPPEQENGSPVFKSDIYALGMIAILALTGKDPNDLFYDAQTNSIQWHNLAHPDLLLGLKRVLDKMIAFDTKYRYATTDALRQLEELKQNIKSSPTVIIDDDEPKKSFPIFKSILGLIVVISSLILLYIKIQPQLILESQKALTLYQKKDYQNALINYDKVIELSPNNYEAWLGKANSLMALAKYSQAIKAYNQAISLNNNSWQAWLSKGDIYSKIQSNQQALESYKKVVIINDNCPIAWKNIAYLNSDQGHSQESAEAFKQFLNRESGSFSDWYFYAKVLSNIQQYNESLDAYNNALKLAQKPTDSVQVWLEKASIFDVLNQSTEEVKALDEVTTIQPNNYRAWYRKGKALEKITGLEEVAAQAYLKSSQIQPSYIFARRNLGRLRLKQKDYTRAKMNFEMVLVYDTNNQEALEQLAYIDQEIAKLRGPVPVDPLKQ